MKKLFIFLFLFAGLKALGQDPAPISPKSVGNAQIFYSIQGGDTLGFVKTPFGYMQVLRPRQATSYINHQFTGAATVTDPLRIKDDTLTAFNHIVLLNDSGNYTHSPYLYWDKAASKFQVAAGINFSSDVYLGYQTHLNYLPNGTTGDTILTSNGRILSKMPLKTIGGSSILGSGDIPVMPISLLSAVHTLNNSHIWSIDSAQFLTAPVNGNNPLRLADSDKYLKITGGVIQGPESFSLNDGVINTLTVTNTNSSNAPALIVNGQSTFNGQAVFENSIYAPDLKIPLLTGTPNAYNVGQGVDSTLEVNRSGTDGILFQDTVLWTTLAGARNSRFLTTADLPVGGYVPTSRTLTINGTPLDLSADRTWTITTANTDTTGTGFATHALLSTYLPKASIVSTYVTYTGATTDVTIGSHNFTAGQGYFSGISQVVANVAVSGGTNEALNVQSTITSASGATGQNGGIFVGVTAGSQANIDQVDPYLGALYHSGGGNIGLYKGAELGNIFLGGTSTITKAYGVEINGQLSTGGTIGELDALHIADNIHTNITLERAIYSQNTSPSELDGPLTVGNGGPAITLTPSATFNGYNSTSSSTKIGDYGFTTYNSNGSFTGNARPFSLTNAYNGNTFALLIGTNATTHATLNSSLALATGTLGFSVDRNGVFNIPGTLTVPTLNGNTFTSGTYTLTGAAGKTLTFNNSITLAGTDGITMTTPTTSFTAARTDASNTFTGHQTIEGVTSTGATGTGNFVFSAGPTFTSTVHLGIFDANGSGVDNIYIGSATATTHQTSSVFQFAGSSANSTRTVISGTGSTITANDNYSGFLVGPIPVTVPTGTSNWVVNAAIATPNITSTGTSTNTATLFIGAAPSVGTNKYTAYFDTGNIQVANGNLTLGTAGNKIIITTGSNASAGTGILSGGTVTISTTAVTANSLIFLTNTNSSIVNVGSLTVSSKSAGVSFTVNSTNVADTSTFNWFIVN